MGPGPRRGAVLVAREIAATQDPDLDAAGRKQIVSLVMNGQHGFGRSVLVLVMHRLDLGPAMTFGKAVASFDEQAILEARAPSDARCAGLQKGWLYAPWLGFWSARGPDVDPG